MKLQALNRQVQVFLDDLKSPKARSARLAKVARDGIAEIRSKNRAATGHDPVPTLFVDCRKGAELDSVRPDGRIVAEFNPLFGVLEWIGEQLLNESPRLTGAYQRSHVLRADGVEVPLDGTIPDAGHYEFTNTAPYARKMEPKTWTQHRRDRSGPVGTRRRWTRTTRTGDGQSLQAPDGVYAAVAAVAATRFGNIARVRYKLDNWDGYNPDTGYTHPIIEVSPR